MKSYCISQTMPKPFQRHLCQAQAASSASANHSWALPLDHPYKLLWKRCRALHPFTCTPGMAAGSTWSIGRIGASDPCATQDIVNALGMVPVLSSAWRCLQVCVTAFMVIKIVCFYVIDIIVVNIVAVLRHEYPSRQSWAQLCGNALLKVVLQGFIQSVSSAITSDLTNLQGSFSCQIYEVF